MPSLPLPASKMNLHAFVQIAPPFPSYFRCNVDIRWNAGFGSLYSLEWPLRGYCHSRHLRRVRVVKSEVTQERSRPTMGSAGLGNDSKFRQAEASKGNENEHSNMPVEVDDPSDYLLEEIGLEEARICIPPQQPPSEQKRTGSDLQTLLRRFWKVAAPYWSSEDKMQARLRLAGIFALTLGTTGISVVFNFLGRDFYNALASKDQDQFTLQLLYYLGAFVGGIPVFVLRDYGRDILALRWRTWMTSYYIDRYFENRAFYQIQLRSLIDNPDQRIVDDLNSFSGTALSFALAVFSATIDLISFSGILFGIYPPLFLVLLIYSIGGTAISIMLGKSLVNLNFLQEKKEADFRYGLIRVRENAESIAFYGGEDNEMQILLQCFKHCFENLSELLVATRNLEFFTSGYRYVIQILPAAVVAPMYFSGKIEFGVINQSYSAFNHILNDFSIVVYQFQALSAFSAVIDRLGEFHDTLDRHNSIATVLSGNVDSSPSDDKSFGDTQITIIDVQKHGAENRLWTSGSPQNHSTLLQIENLSLQTPQYTVTLIKNLSIVIRQEEDLLITGASGSGKTSLLRAIAGLWRSGTGTIKRYLQYEDVETKNAVLNISDANGCAKTPDLSVTHHGAGEQVGKLHKERSDRSFDRGRTISFLPQKPYMILGTLRQQLLYPTWIEDFKSDSKYINKG
eukprot:c27291_g1_i3 orf=121-2163(+)